MDIKRPGSTVVFWDVDAPATLDRVMHNGADPFSELIPRYDLVLTYGGGDPVVDAYMSLGARACIPVYNALDPATHYPVRPEPRFSCDLGFMGTGFRTGGESENFLRTASMAPDMKFILGGSGWSGKPMSGNIEYIGHVSTNDHNAFNCSARAVLNINRASMARIRYSPTASLKRPAPVPASLLTVGRGIELFLNLVWKFSRPRTAMK